jgi:hypothetical protein
MAQATDSPIPNPTLPTRPLPLACCVGTGFVPVIYHPTRVAEYQTSADEALAYAARVIWHRQRRAADKRRKLVALSHPRYFSYFLDAAK